MTNVLEFPEVQNESQTEVQTTAPIIADKTALIDKTVFLKVSFKMLGAERAVQGAEQLVQTEADKSLLKVKKALFVSPEFRAIVSANSRLRNKLKQRCIHGILDGVSVVPLAAVEEIQEWLLEHEARFKELVTVFKAVYPELYKQAQTLLGPMFDSGDYPDPARVQEAFSYKYEYVSFAVPEKLKALNGALYHKQTQQAEQIMQSAADKIAETQTIVFSALVEKLKTELAPGEDGKEKTFHKSAIEKLKAFIKDFSVMDVTNNAQLSAHVAKCNALVSGITAENVRESETFRTDLLQKVTDIGASLAPLVQDKTRKLKIIV